MQFNQLLFFWYFVVFQRSVYALLDNAKSILPLQDSNGIIRVTDANYDELKSGVFDYYNILFITTTKSNKQGLVCETCNKFEPIYRKVSLATHQQAPGAKVLFFQADVSENRKLVKEIGLTTIPHVLVFPPPQLGDEFKWSKSEFYQYELNSNSVKTPLHFGDFLAKILKVYIGISEDFEYKEFAIYFAICVIVFSILKRKVLPMIPNKSKFFCGLFALGIIMLSITGFKFTQMNGIPFIARDSKGQIMYFSGGMSWQFGIEIFTVSMMYIGMGLATLTLIYIVKTGTETRLKNGAMIAISCLVYYTFSYFLSCFKIKNPEYPYTI